VLKKTVNFRLKLAVFNSSFFMILVLSYSGCRQKNVWGGEGKGQRKHQDREIAPITFPPFYQWRDRRRTCHAPRVHLKEMLHQEPHVKSEDFLWRNTHFWKNVHLFRKFQPDFM